MGGPVPLLDGAPAVHIHASAAMTVFALGVVELASPRATWHRSWAGSGSRGTVALVPMAGFAESGEEASLLPKSLEKRRKKPRAASS